MGVRPHEATARDSLRTNVYSTRDVLLILDSTSGGTLQQTRRVVCTCVCGPFFYASVTFCR